MEVGEHQNIESIPIYINESTMFDGNQESTIN